MSVRSRNAAETPNLMSLYGGGPDHMRALADTAGVTG